MQAALSWADPVPAPRPPSEPSRAVPLPAAVDALVWRGTQLGQVATSAVCPSGWAELDAQLPGGGWPQRALSELLTTQASILEWRLLAPALRPIVAGGGQVIIVGPPLHPHVPGLVAEGLDERQLVWIQADTPAERLWVTEQVLRSNAAGAVVAWLSHARQEQLRRLQVSATGFDGPVFLCRPEAARHESSAAPLRVLASLGLDWEIELRVLKRRGPAHDEVLRLPSVPASLAAVLTPRLRRPSRLLARQAPAASPLPLQEAGHALGRPWSQMMIGS
jgi:protein ImuA